MKLDVRSERAERLITPLASLMDSNVNVAQLILVSIVKKLLDSR